MYISNDLRSGRNVSAHTRETVQQGETAAVNFVSIKQVEVGARRVRGICAHKTEGSSDCGSTQIGQGENIIDDAGTASTNARPCR